MPTQSLIESSFARSGRSTATNSATEFYIQSIFFSVFKAQICTRNPYAKLHVE